MLEQHLQTALFSATCNQLKGRPVVLFLSKGQMCADSPSKALSCILNWTPHLIGPRTFRIPEPPWLLPKPPTQCLHVEELCVMLYTNLSEQSLVRTLSDKVSASSHPSRYQPLIYSAMVWHVLINFSAVANGDSYNRLCSILSDMIAFTFPISPLPAVHRFSVACHDFIHFLPRPRY